MADGRGEFIGEFELFQQRVEKVREFVGVGFARAEVGLREEVLVEVVFWHLEVNRSLDGTYAGLNVRDDGLSVG